MNDHKIKSIISNYGVTLKRLTEDKIELVRRWRNDPKIQQYMEFREEITPEMQKAWFRRINNEFNLFYIIENDGKGIGLINIKDIKDNQGEGGIFIWDDHCLNSDISYRAHLALFDLVFSTGMINSIISHVLRDNVRAQRFTAFLGFRMADNQDKEFNQMYILTSDEYFHSKNRQRYVKRFNLLK